MTDSNSVPTSQDPEEWRPVAGYEGIYEIGNRGTVRSVPRHDARGYRRQGETLRPAMTSLSGRGYLSVVLSGKPALPRHGKSVARLVAEAFLPPPEMVGRLCVDHINGDRADNRVENLRWATYEQNSKAFQKPRRGKTSKYRGVYKGNPSPGWVARIGNAKNGSRHVGVFATQEEAALAYNKAAIEAGFLPEALNVIHSEELLSA